MLGFFSQGGFLFKGCLNTDMPVGGGERWCLLHLFPRPCPSSIKLPLSLPTNFLTSVLPVFPPTVPLRVCGGVGQVSSWLGAWLLTRAHPPHRFIHSSLSPIYVLRSKRDVAAANFSLHEAHCLRFLTLCPECDEPVAQKDMKDHLTEAHKQVRNDTRSSGFSCK